MKVCDTRLITPRKCPCCKGIFNVNPRSAWKAKAVFRCPHCKELSTSEQLDANTQIEERGEIG
jgi:hypothetical protein